MAYIDIRTPQKFTNPANLIRIPDLNTGLLVDYDADTITGNTGTEVTSWEPAAGSLALPLDALPPNGNATYPTLVDGTAGGHKAVKFDGQHNLRGNSGVEILASGAPATVLLVVKDNDTTAVGRYLAGFNTATDFRNVRISSGKFTAGAGTSTSGTSSAQLAEDMPVGQWGVYVVRWGDGRVKIDSSTGGTADVPGTPGPLTGLSLGATYTATAYELARAEIARLQIFNRALEDHDVAALLSLMRSRYGLTG